MKRNAEKRNSNSRERVERSLEAPSYKRNYETISFYKMKSKKLSMPFQSNNLTDESCSPKNTNLTLDELSPDLPQT
jgi:hypothetical protein